MNITRNPVGWFEIYGRKFSIKEYGFISIACDTEGNTSGLHSLK